MPTYLLLLLVMAALFYLMILRPQQRAKREKQALLNALQVGVEISTIGGIYGRVAALRDEDLDLEIAEGVVMRVDRRAVATIVPDDVDEAEEELDDEDDGDAAHDTAPDDAHDVPVDATADAESGEQGRTT